MCACVWFNIYNVVNRWARGSVGWMVQCHALSQDAEQENSTGYSCATSRCYSSFSRRPSGIGAVRSGVAGRQAAVLLPLRLGGVQPLRQAGHRQQAGVGQGAQQRAHHQPKAAETHTAHSTSRSVIQPQPHPHCLADRTMTE